MMGAGVGGAGGRAMAARAATHTHRRPGGTTTEPGRAGDSTVGTRLKCSAGERVLGMRRPQPL